MSARYLTEEVKRYLHVLVLWNLAVAQPVLDVLSKQPAFFTARYAGPMDIVIFPIVLSLWLPIPLLFVEVLGKRIGPRTTTVMHGLVIGLLIVALCLQVLQSFETVIPAVLLVVVAVLAAIGLVACYFRVQALRMVLTVLSPAILVIPGLFIFSAPISDLVFEKHRYVATADPGIDRPKAEALPTIVLIVFDELPITSMVDTSGNLDSVRFPHFAELAKDATWFRNATTVAAYTMEATTAILTGTYPSTHESNGGLHPAAASFQNLFIYLWNTHRMHVDELLTRLCRGTLCGQSFGWSSRQTCSELVDSGVLYLHLLLPKDFQERLPDISNRWTHFVGEPEGCKYFLVWRSASLEERRAERFYEFVDGIEPSDRPTLHFIHTNLPHSPWIYRPSGEPSGSTLGLYHRHLLQVGFADSLLGQLINRLKRKGLYDSSMIIVSADHGVSFWPEEHVRDPEKAGDLQDIMGVPLLIKVPNQRQGEISDRNVETIDVLPTIADVQGMPLPWPVDGQSVFRDDRPRQKKFLSGRNGYRRTVPARFSVVSPGVQHRLALFGARTDWSELHRAPRQTGQGQDQPL